MEIVCAPEPEPWSCGLQPLNCLVAKPTMQKKHWKVAHPQGPSPDTCQRPHQFVILTDGHLPSQLLPLASTLGAQDPGGFRGSQAPLCVNVVALGSDFPSFYYASSALYIWGTGPRKGVP